MYESFVCVCLCLCTMFILTSTNATNVLGLKSVYVRWEGSSALLPAVGMVSFLSLANEGLNVMNVRSVSM